MTDNTRVLYNVRAQSKFWVLYFFVYREKHTQHKERYQLDIHDSETVVRAKEQKKPVAGKQLVWHTLGLFANTGISIAVPILAGTFIGKYIDQQFEFGSKATLAGIGIGFVLSIVTLARILKSFVREAN